MDGPAVNQEQAEAISEVEAERAMNILRYIATTDNIESSSEQNRSTVKLFEAKSQWYQTVSRCAIFVAFASAAALLIAVIR